MNDRPNPEFSPREKQLLDFAAQGLTDTAIAHRLGISEATVGTYWGRVRIKLGPYSRTELVAIVLRAEQAASVEALRKENEELVSRVQELASGGSTLCHDVIENAPDAMLLVSTDGVIEYANEAARELFGYSMEELEGKEVLKLIPSRLRDVHDQHRQYYIADHARRPMGEHLETPAVHQDGTEFPIRAVLSTTETPNGLLVICAIRPVNNAR